MAAVHDVVLGLAATRKAADAAHVVVINHALLIADAIGIVIGVNLGKKIPERAVKWFAALIFIFFGAYGLYEYTPSDLLTAPVVIGSLALIILLVVVLGRGDLVKLFQGPRSS